MSKWLHVFIEQHGDDNDYNDSDEVMGYLSASLVGDVLTVNYEPDEDGGIGPKTSERYQLVALSE